MIECKVCGESFEVPADVEEGELVDCPNCAAEYEVTSTDPIGVELFEEDEK